MRLELPAIVARLVSLGQIGTLKSKVRQALRYSDYFYAILNRYQRYHHLVTISNIIS